MRLGKRPRAVGFLSGVGRRQDDRLAVLWACDAEFDRDNVSDFLGYPLGLHAPSTDAASRMLSALWDAVTLGLTPISLNRVLGAVFGVPMVERDTVVESVTEDGDDSIVVTGDEVYRIETDRLSQGARTAGTALRAGSFLTDEISVYWGLSADDVAQLLDDGRLGRVVLPPGSVAGVDEAVVIESGVRDVEDGGWFKLNDGDSADSPFWQAVFARTTEDERKALCVAMGATEDDPRVDPFRSLVPAVLANQIRVYASRSLPADPYAGLVLDYLQQLVPSYASLVFIQEAAASDGGDTVPLEQPAPPEEGEDSMPGADDSVSSIVYRPRTEPAGQHLTPDPCAEDRVSFRLIPLAATEV